MGPLEQILHTFNFIAPAWGVALFCVLVARLTARWWLPLASWGLMRQTLVSGVLGTAVFERFDRELKLRIHLFS